MTTGTVIIALGFVGFDAVSFFSTVFQLAFVVLALKTFLVLAPAHGLYVVLFSAATRSFKIRHLLSTLLFVFIVAMADLYFDGALRTWWRRGAQRQEVALAIALVLFVGLFEVRLAPRWYSLFYNQRRDKVALGLLTIVSDGGSMAAVVGFGSNNFTGRLPTRTRRE